MVDIQRLIRNALALVVGLLLGGLAVYAQAADKWYLTTLTECNSPPPNDPTYQYSSCPAYSTGVRLAPYQPPLGTVAQMQAVVAWAGVGSGAFPESIYYNNPYQPADKRTFPACGSPFYQGNTASGSLQQIVIQQSYCNPVNNKPSVSIKRSLYFVLQAEVACETGIVNPDGSCFTCPADRVWNGSACVPPECPAGEVWDDAQRACRMDCDLAASQPPSRSHVSQGGALCLMGCKRTRGAVPGGSNCVMQVDVADGSGGLVCDYAWTGEQCDWTGEKGAGDDPAPNDPVAEEEGEDEQCGAGYVSGTVNGQQTCLLGGPPVDTIDKKTETKTNPDGTTETKHTTTKTEVKADGTVTTTTTTTTIIKDAAGNVVGTDVDVVGTTQGKDGFCEENPDDSVCGGGGSGELAGACVPGGGVQELVCDGDAIQCAIREQTMRTYCQLTASEEVVAEYEAIKAFDGTGEGQGLDRKEIEVPTSLAVTEIGGGAGLQDQSFTVMGKTIVIPFSELNRFIEMLGYAIMAIAWLGAWRIIAGAF